MATTITLEQANKTLLDSGWEPDGENRFGFRGVTVRILIDLAGKLRGSQMIYQICHPSKFLNEIPFPATAEGRGLTRQFQPRQILIVKSKRSLSNNEYCTETIYT